MPQYQTIHIPGEGDVEFPASMSDTDIAGAITRMRSGPATPQAVQPPTIQRGFSERRRLNPSPPRTNLPMAGAVGYEYAESQPWQGPEPPAATATKGFFGKSMVAPGFQEEMGERVQERRANPRDIPMMRFGEPGPVPGFEKETPMGPVQAGVAKGMAGMVEHLTTPTSIAVMSLLPAVYGVPFFKALIEAGFSYTMISHVIDETPELVDRMKAGDVEGAVEKAVEVGGSAGLAVLTGRGAYKTVKGRLYDPIMERSKWKEVPPERQGIAEPRQQLQPKREVAPPTETDITRRVRAEEDITGMIMEGPKVVEVPGEGKVEFPASMSTVEIQEAIGSLKERQTQTPAIPPREQPRTPVERPRTSLPRRGEVVVPEVAEKKVKTPEEKARMLKNLADVVSAAPTEAQVQAVVITGKTYPHRREIKAIGGKWNPEQEGWVIPADRQAEAEAIAEKHGFDIDTAEVEAEALETPTGERLRGIRQEKANKKADRLRAQANRMDSEASSIDKSIPEYASDYAFITQPANPGTTLARTRERINRKKDKAIDLSAEARELRARADSLEKHGGRIAGDAERSRQKVREALDTMIKVGSRVIDNGFAQGEGTVVRVNKKSYTIQFDAGFKYARDKSYVRPLGEPPKGEPTFQQQAETFQRESKLKDDKAKLDMAAKSPQGEMKVRGPLFQREKQLGFKPTEPIKTKIVRPPRTQVQRTKTHYDPGTPEFEIATRGGIKLDLTKEEHQRFLIQNPKAKTKATSFSRFDPIYSKAATMTVDQWYETLKEEGVIPPQWEQSDFEAYLTDRTRKGYRGVNFQDAQEIDVPQTLQEYEARTAEPSKYTLDAGALDMDILFSNPLVPMAQFWEHKIGRPLWEKATSLLMKASPEFVKRALVVRYGQPQEYIEASKRRKLAVTKGIEEAQEIGEALTLDLTLEEQQALGRLIKGEAKDVDLSRMRNDKRWFEAIEAAKMARQELDSLGGQAVIQGLLKNETFFNNYGKYMPRMYRKHEVNYDALAKQTGSRKPTRLELSRFQKRQDIPEPVRVLMGEILEPGYPVVKGMAQLRHDVETAKLFNFVADNPEWTLDLDKPLFAQGKSLKDYTKMPEGKKLGRLSGAYVVNAIASDLNEIVRHRGDLERISASLMSEWKFMKVVVNPSTHARNMMSNTILAYLGGLPPTRLDIYGKAIWQLAKGGDSFQEASDIGLFRGTFIQAELDLFLDSWNKSTGNFQDRMASLAKSMKDATAPQKLENIRLSKTKLGQKASQLYQLEESWFKLAKFMHNREKGMSVKESADDAQEWLFDYTEVPRMVDWVRRHPWGSPFLTFTYKALPQVAKSAVIAPWRMMAIVAGLYAVQDYSRKKLGLTGSQWERLNRVKPDWMKGEFIGPKHLLLPYKDKYDRLQFLDLTYILPWGDVGETGATGLPNALPIIGSPMMIIPEIALNKQEYSGREIYNPNTDTTKEVAQKIGLHVYRTVAPSLAPGGYSFSKLVSAISGEEDYFGRERNIPAALSSTLAGLKVTSIDVDREAMFRQYEHDRRLRDIGAALRSTQRNQSLSPSARKRKVDSLNDQRIKLIQDFTKRPGPQFQARR